MLKTGGVIFTILISQSRSCIKVLVPGAGLGRLAYEIARLGLSSQGQ